MSSTEAHARSSKLATQTLKRTVEHSMSFNSIASYSLREEQRKREGGWEGGRKKWKKHLVDLLRLTAKRVTSLFTRSLPFCSINWNEWNGGGEFFYGVIYLIAVFVHFFFLKDNSISLIELWHCWFPTINVMFIWWISTAKACAVLKRTELK